MRKYFAPGRVKLVGEPLEFNGGMVLPAAIFFVVDAFVTENKEGFIQFSSFTHKQIEQGYLLDSIKYESEKSWSNYALDVVPLTEIALVCYELVLGCAMASVESIEVEKYRESVLSENKRKTGYNGEIYNCTISDGVLLQTS